jgi:predicted phosphohydrolase
MRLEEAMEDINALAALPGRKILLRGNHDYWWSALSRVRAALPEGMEALQNNAVALGGGADGLVIAGTRGWTMPGDGPTAEQDMRIYRRELIRLEMSLADGRRLSPDGPMVAMLHYPPFDEGHGPSEVTRLLNRFGVAEAVYGHLHGAALRSAFDGVLEGVRYHQVSCDGLGFVLRELETGYGGT